MPSALVAFGLAACEGGGSGNFIVDPPANPVFPLDLALGQFDSLADSGVTDALRPDLDGDGLSDLVEAAQNPNIVRVDFGPPGGTLQELPLPGVPLRLVEGDFDGDGAPEMIALCRLPGGPGGGGQGGGPLGGFDAPTRLVLFEAVEGELLSSMAEFEFASVSAFASAVRLDAQVDRDELLVPLVYEQRIARVRFEGGGLFETQAPAGMGYSDGVHGPLEVDFVDLGADGRMDLVFSELPTVPGFDGRIVLQRQIAAGTFATAEPFVDGLAIPRVRVIGDIDRDTDIDIGIADAGADPGRVGFCQQLATGFGPANWVPTVGPTSDVLATDVDGNGVVDLIAALPYEQGFTVFRGLPSAIGEVPVFAQGRLVLGGPQIRRISRSSSPGAPLEVVTGLGRIVIGVAADGTLRAPTGHVAGDDLVIMTLGDIDQDGYVDAVCVDRQQLRLVFMAGEPGPRFGLGATVPLTGGAEDSPGDVELGDLDGDGFLDTAVCLYSFSELRTFSGAGSLTPEGPTRQFPVGDRPLGLDLADLDLDGDLDASVGLWGASALVTLRNDGQGVLEAWNSIQLPGRTTDVSSADVDLDGRPELVFGIEQLNGAGAGIGILETNTEAGDPALIWSFVADLELAPLRLVVHDWNGDGRPDIGCDQAGLTANSMPLFLSGADATSFKRIDLDLGPGPGAPLPLDVDADGRSDLLSTQFNGSIAVLGNGGEGSFTKLEPSATGGRAVPVGVSDARLADLDGDGQQELIFLGPFARSLWIGKIDALDDGL